MQIIGEKRNLRGAVLALLAIAILSSASWANDPEKAPSAIDDHLEAQAVTANMDRLYEMILQKFSDDAIFIAKMQAAQVAWCRFRDAHIEALYPAENKAIAYGSAYQRCRRMAIVALTRQRIEQLHQWLDGVAEGDVCAGSLPLY